MFVFWPPWTTFGEIVVCVAAWQVRASGGGRTSIVSQIARRVEQAGADLVGHRHRLNLGLPHLGDLRLRPVDRQAAHHLGGLDQRVVRAERHRAVGRGAGDAQPPPGDALLAGVHRDAAHAVLADGGPSTDLGEHEVAGDRVPVVLAHPLRTPSAAGFLVGHAEVDQGALRPPARAGQLAERHGLRRGDVEHVDRAAAPHLAVDQFTAERILRPAVGVHRDDVGVAHQAQRRRRRIAALDARHHRRAAGSRGEVLDRHAGAFEVLLEQLGVAYLTAGVGGAVVDALVADQRLEQLGGRSHELVGHVPVLPPRTRRRLPTMAPCRPP